MDSEEFHQHGILTLLHAAFVIKRLRSVQHAKVL